MAICWYCYWGWPKQVRDIYDLAAEQCGEDALEFGPGHIVWSDENFEDDSIRWCLGLYNPEEFRKIYPNTTFEHMYADHDAHSLAVVKESLEKLLAVPAEVRCCEPVGYDGENPADYPPPAGLTMVS